MANASDYMLGSEVECERLERHGDLHGKERLLDHVALEPGQSFLDAGCGSGWVVRYLARQFPQAQFTGVDLNPDYVAFAEARAAAERLDNVTFSVGNAFDLPFPAAGFDLTWSQFVLYHLPDPLAGVRELARVTRPGGRVVAAAHERPMLENLPHDEDLQPRMERLMATIMHDWRSASMPGLFAAAGLVDIDLTIEKDTIYSKAFGPIDQPRRRNIEEVLRKPVEALADILGGPTMAQEFLARWVAYYDRPDTTCVTTYWVATGTKPA